jgi:heme/copper-type cytochrome/quinol oxidase subunit 2
MKRIGALVIAVLALALAGCTHHAESTSGPKASGLNFKLTAEPDRLFTSESSVGRTVRFTLVADNRSDDAFTGVATVGSVAHFVVKSGEQTLWEGPELALQVNKPVRIDARSNHDYIAVWHIDNIEALPAGNLTVDAEFTPTGEHRMLTIPVRR